MGRRFGRLALAGFLIAALLLAGCTQKSKRAALVPKVKPPVIAEAGVLRAAIDLSYPPFGGRATGVKAGLDLDVAAAIADKLGLTLQVVDVKAVDIPEALSSGKADIGFGALPITDAVLADVSSAGTYLVDGPALFSAEPSAGADASASADASAALDPSRLADRKVGAQKGSAGYWRLADDYGEGFAVGYPTLREAFRALAAGEIDAVVGDAAVGSYLARDFKGVSYAGQYGAGTPLGVSVKKDATQLEQAVGNALTGLTADGVLDTIRIKWLGDIPALETTDTATNG